MDLFFPCRSSRVALIPSFFSRGWFIQFIRADFIDQHIERSDTRQLAREKNRRQGEKRTITLPTDCLLPAAHWNLNTDRTGKIAFLGAFPWIARNIQDASGFAMTTGVGLSTRLTGRWNPALGELRLGVWGMVGQCGGFPLVTV